ncbi:MAG: 3D domain-containing protein [Eubacteriales bacterium]|jgi:3D (Asp-Asp-Asp) domain-containing protein
MLRIWSILAALSTGLTPGVEAVEPVEVNQLQNTYVFTWTGEQYMTGLTLPEEGESRLVLDSIPSNDDIVWTAESKALREKLREQSQQVEQAPSQPDAPAQLPASQQPAAEKPAEQSEEIPGLPQGAELLGTYSLTAYCPCEKCCGKTPSDPGYGITASGAVAQEGVTIAMDKFPFGTRVYIEGVGERVVQDRGGAIKGNRIDIFCSTHERCFENPNYVGTARVWILK